MAVKTANSGSPIAPAMVAAGGLVDCWIFVGFRRVFAVGFAEAAHRPMLAGVVRAFDRYGKRAILTHPPFGTGRNRPLCRGQPTVRGVIVGRPDGDGFAAGIDN